MSVPVKASAPWVSFVGSVPPLGVVAAVVVAAVVVVTVVDSVLDDGVGVGVFGTWVGPCGGGLYGGELGDAALAGDIETAWTNGTVQAAATPTTAPRLSKARRLKPVATTGSSIIRPPKVLIRVVRRIGAGLSIRCLVQIRYVTNKEKQARKSHRSKSSISWFAAPARLTLPG
jgi:hypothetical protein